MAAEYALVQETVLERQRLQISKGPRQLPVTKFTAPRQENPFKPQFAAGDLWCAKQLRVQKSQWTLLQLWSQVRTGQCVSQ